jgi:hypothetical protein
VAYLARQFDLKTQAERLRDGRRHAQIATASVWLSAFTLFVMRYRSFNALEQDLRRSRWLDAFIGRRKPSADTLGRTLGTLSLADLRELLARVSRQAWRSKSIHQRCGEKLRVVAVDGHELGASTARCCDACLVREVKEGEKTALQYYHRVVVAQWVGVSPPALLDVELIRPGEGEVVAARRLVERVVLHYDRLVDVVCGDALYLEAPFCREMLEAGRHFVVVMNQEARALHQDADGLRQIVAPTVLREGSTTTRMWDLPDLATFTNLDRPVRVVWAEEETAKIKVLGGRRTPTTDASTWVWATDLPPTLVSAQTIARWGHNRWDIENRCFNELAATWSMDHCFVHHPNAIQALLLTLFLAFLTTYLFFQRNLKPPARRHLSRLALASRFREDLATLAGASLWPPPEPSG